MYGRKIQGSVTRLEQYARCAYGQFLTYGLGLQQREESGFAPVDVGNLYHNALLLYSERLEASEYDWHHVPDSVRDEMAEQAMEDAAMSHPLFGEEATAEMHHTIDQMKRVMKQTVWALTEQVKKGEYVPQKFEVRFTSEMAPNLILNGRIDRLDLCENPEEVSLKVIDYKSGNTAFDLVKIYYGTQLQLAVYMDCVLRQKEKENPLLEVMPGGMLYYHIDDPVIDLGDDTPDDMISEEEINTMILRRLKPDGLINSDENAYRGMDTDFEGASDVIPVKLKKDMTPDAYSKVASKEEIDIICDYAGKKLKQIADDIYNGDISVNPFSSIKSDSCAYCAYQPVCRIGSKLPGFVGRSMPNMKKDEVIDRMNTDIHKK